MNKYQIEKEKAREKAIQFQHDISMGAPYSYYDLANIQARFERLAKRYGLLKEFRANAII